MPTKVNKPTAPIIITITLPDEDKLVRTGQLLIQRGEQATLGQFEYSSLEDIMAAIERGTTRLMGVEANPPDLKPVSKPAQAQPAASTAPASTTETPAETTAGEAEGTEASQVEPAAEATHAHTPQLSADPAAQDNQLSLF
jgi:hypothetical protein